MILKVVGIDGIENYRARIEDNLRVIDFRNKIDHAEEQNKFEYRPGKAA